MNQHVFAQNALQCVGQSYAMTDCIGVVRRAAGIKCQGTNWLWRSINNSPKYRYLIERSTNQLDQDQLQDGLLVFRIRFDKIPKGYVDPPDCHHVGVVVRNNARWEVVQSNPASGVTASAFQGNQWDGWGKLKMITYAGPDQEPEQKPETEPDKLDEIYRMVKALYDALIKQQYD